MWWWCRFTAIDFRLSPNGIFVNEHSIWISIIENVNWLVKGIFITQGSPFVGNMSKHVKTCQNVVQLFQFLLFPCELILKYHIRDLPIWGQGALVPSGCVFLFFPFDSKLSSAVFIHCGWHFKRSKIITHFNFRRICWCTERCRHSGEDEPFLKSINIWSSAKELQSRIRSSCAYFLLHQPTQAWSFERQSAAS